MDHSFSFLASRAIPTYARSAAARWLLRRWSRAKALTLDRRKNTLVYVGMHKGREFDVMFRQYRQCYGFEANPELYSLLVDKYKDHPQVKLFNFAAAEKGGPVTFNISSNEGASSSIGTFDEQWNHFRSGEIQMVRQVTVEAVNLSEFLRAQQVDFIDDYVSDIQGMDLAVLRTLKPFIDEGRIGTVTVETTREGRRNIYKDLPDNSESGFWSLLGSRYSLVAIGFGVLEDYWFEEVGADAWEADCKWRSRSRRPPGLPGNASAPR